jgi:transposase
MAQKLPSIEVLTHHYVDEHLTLQKIGDLYGATGEAVRLALKKATVPKVCRYKEVNLARLRELYLDEGLTYAEIASELGVSKGRVTYELLRQKLTRPQRFNYHTRRVTREMIEELYITQGKTQIRVASELGLRLRLFQRMLSFYKISKTEPRTIDRTRLIKEVVPDEALRRAYVEEGLTITQIAKRYGFSRFCIGRRLTELGIPRRNPKIQTLELDRKTLERLWVTEELSAETIGKRFHRSKVTVYKLLDEYKIPRRTRPKRLR